MRKEKINNCKVKKEKGMEKTVDKMREEESITKKELKE